MLPTSGGMGLSVERPAAPIRPAQIHQMRPSRQKGHARYDSLLRVRVMDQQANAGVSKAHEEAPERHRRPSDDREGPHGHHVDAPRPDRVHEGHQSLPGLPSTGVARRHVSVDPMDLMAKSLGQPSDIEFLRRGRMR